MSAEIKQLRAKIAELKSAPIFQKAALAEQAIDALIVVIERQQFLIELNLTNEAEKRNG